ncbi:MAG TPA: hypothetical protein VFO84_10660 [Dehalococcoidia bacterium]|nr:hypothetical protein [Dehalococcoidia bacterium]
MWRLLAGATFSLICLACDSTPLPGDDQSDQPAAIDPLSTSLDPSQMPVALTQLTGALASNNDARTQLLRALESPGVTLNDESLALALRNLTARGFEVAWLASLLTLAADEESSSEATAASAALRTLAISVLHEVLSTSSVRNGLDEGTMTLNQARSVLVEAFGSLRPAGEDDRVLLLPEDVAEPTLSLARSTPTTTLLPERTAGFTTVASAVEQATTAEIISGEDVSATRTELAALSRLALLTGRGSEPPSSPFGSYVLNVPVAEQLVYSLSGRETVGVLPSQEQPIVSLDIDDDGSVGATILDVESEGGDLQVRSSTRSVLGQERIRQPAFGRPDASLSSGFGIYQLAVEVPFINPVNAPFRVTCLVPSLGARITVTLASREAQGQLRASGRIVLAPQQVAMLASEAQVVCAGSYGTVETGQIAIPPELVPQSVADD